MKDAAAALVGGALAIGFRELWSISKTLYLDRRRASDAKADRELELEEIERKAADVRFAEFAGQIHGWEIRFAYVQRELAAVEKLKADMNAAFARIRELELELKRLSRASAESAKE